MDDKPKTRTCQLCGGFGGEIDVILDDGTGPWEECWACGGKGEMTGAQINIYLYVKRMEKNEQPIHA